MPAGEERWLLRLGAVSAVLGALLAGVGNILHPVTPRDDPAGAARVVADSGQWTAVHLVIVLGTLLIPVALIAVRRSLAGDGLGEALARVGVYTATIGTAVGMVLLILDGVAAKQLADQWAAAPASDKQTALALFAAHETENFALAGLFNMAYAGVPFVLFGLALTRSAAYPHVLGWIAVVAGTGSIFAGLFQSLSGRPTTTSLILTVVGPTVITVWVLVVGVLMWRRRESPT